MRSKIVSLIMILAMSLTLLPLMSCSKNLGPETLPSTTVTVPTETTPTETTAETTPAETEPLPQPTSIPLVTNMPVKQYGQLIVTGNQITTKSKSPVILRGVSSSPLNECAGFYGIETVKTIAEDWGADVIRISVPADKSEDSYITQTEKYFKQTCDIIDLCISQGIYVIVNWHNSANGDPNTYKKQAVAFFTRIAGIYADSPNVMYEVCNESNGVRYGDKKKRAVDWKNSVKPFAEEVIKAIRAIDKDNIIIVGTSDYCRDIEAAANNPIKGSNIVYSVHFSAGTDTEELQTKIHNSKQKGICIFVTEWEATDSSGVSAANAENTAKWLDFLNESEIGWCNAYIYANNTSNRNGILFDTNGRYSLEDIFAGHWPDGLISPSGIIVRDRLLAAKGTKKPDTVYTPEELPDFGDGGDEGDDEPDAPDPED